jgi:C-terminal peptidase prc
MILLSACGNNSSHKNLPANSTKPAVFDESEKSYLYSLFQAEYYWNDQVPQNFDYSAYTEPQPMIDALKYTTLDHWSFALTRQQYDEMSTQKTAGFGFGYQGDFTIYTVLIGSPAEAAGLLRGDKILTINGQTATKALLSQASDALGQTARFGIERAGTPMDLSITAQEYTYNVISYKTLQTNLGQRVGYLRFDEFSENATDELETAFNYFKNQHIDKLVVDLRYNPGGSVNTASIFLDKIGRPYNGQVQMVLAWNAQNSSQNETLTFDSLDPNSLTVGKIVFLTTSHSASASEAVINAMKPYMHSNAAIVGTRTHGKPVGMAGRTNGSYIYYLINFLVENSVGFSDYFNGLAPDCEIADDDFSHQLGDPNEALLREALYYIDNDHC